MFGKDDKKVDSVIGVEAEIKGNIVSKATIRIDGKIEGSITCEGDVVIGKDGKVKGDIKAKGIIIGGKVTGNINAENRTEILEGGQLVGDIRSPAVIIAEGGIFDGYCEMVSKEKGKVVEISEREQKVSGRIRSE
jgi:cytoskeletal protein CcmA (bactofilin family)